jgi:hypothetical protein
MNSIYKNASYVLVWLGPDPQSMAEKAFRFVRDLAEIFQNKEKSEEFHINHTELLHERSGEAWFPLEHVTNLPWVSQMEAALPPHINPWFTNIYINL